MPSNKKSSSLANGDLQAVDGAPAEEHERRDTMEDDSSSESGDSVGDDDLDGDALKNIGKSLHYNDILMTLRHNKERLKFFTDFAKSMPPGKFPKHKLELYEARVDVAKERLEKFKTSYIEKREKAKKTREERFARERAEREAEDNLGKPLKAVIVKGMKKSSNDAAKAAAAAVASLGEDASQEDQIKAGMEAFSKALMTNIKGGALKAAAKEAKDAQEAKEAKAAEREKAKEARAAAKEAAKAVAA